MAKSKSTQRVELSDDDLKSAVEAWLAAKFGGVGWRIRFGTKTVYEDNAYHMGSGPSYEPSIDAERDLP